MGSASKGVEGNLSAGKEKVSGSNNSMSVLQQTAGKSCSAFRRSGTDHQIEDRCAAARRIDMQLVSRLL